MVNPRASSPALGQIVEHPSTCQVNSPPVGKGKGNREGWTGQSKNNVRLKCMANTAAVTRGKGQLTASIPGRGAEILSRDDDGT